MPKTIRTKLAGVTAKNEETGHRRQTLIRKFVNDGDALELVREPENPFDSNAIAVFPSTPDPDEYECIGYLIADLAKELAPLLDAGQAIDCDVSNITGGEEGQPTLGVNVNLTVLSQEETLARKDQIRRYRETHQPPATSQPPTPSIKTKPVKINSNKSPKNFWILLLIFVLSGYVGGHRYYAGRGSLLYSITLAYFMFGYIFDFIVIILGQFTDKQGHQIQP